VHESAVTPPQKNTLNQLIAALMAIIKDHPEVAQYKVRTAESISSMSIGVNLVEKEIIITV
jgi:hypothetical protein